MSANSDKAKAIADQSIKLCKDFNQKTNGSSPEENTEQLIKAVKAESQAFNKLIEKGFFPPRKPNPTKDQTAEAVTLTAPRA